MLHTNTYLESGLNIEVQAIQMFSMNVFLYSFGDHGIIGYIHVIKIRKIRWIDKIHNKRHRKISKTYRLI